MLYMKNRLILITSIFIAIALTGLALFLAFSGGSVEEDKNNNSDQNKVRIPQETPETPRGYQLFTEDKPREVETSTLPTTTKTSFHFPEDWSLEVVEEEGLENFADEFYTLSSPDNVLEVNIDYKFKTDPDFEVPRNRIFPDIYQYDRADYELVATIDGGNLLISRTGATNLFIGAENNPILLADSQIQQDKIYYIYQQYPEGISEYLNIFQRAEVEYPNYDYNTIVYYEFKQSISQTEWEKIYKPELIEIISSIRI